MGILIFGMFVIYVAVTLLLAFLVTIAFPDPKRKRIALLSVIVLSILLLVWDIPVGKINFSRYCESEAGQFILKRVRLGPEYFLKPGEPNKRYFPRDELYYAKGGELNLERVINDYEINSKRENDFSRWGHIRMRKTTIVHKDTSEILSRATSFAYGGGWLMDWISDGHSGSNVCPAEAKSSRSRPYTIHSNLADLTFYESNTR